jgi:hypothetical protein
MGVRANYGVREEEGKDGNGADPIEKV